MFNIWGYIRQQAKNAFLAGIGDGMAEIEGPQDVSDTTGAIGFLQRRQSLALAIGTQDGQAQESESPSQNKRRSKA